MKSRVCLLLLALFAFQTALAEVEEQTDRFTGETTFSYRNDLSTAAGDEFLGPPTLIVLSTHKEATTTYAFMISTATSTSGGRGWRYLNVTSISWLVDGKQTKFGEPVIDRRAESGFVMETFVQDFTAEQFEQLSSAKSVEFRIGLDEFALSKADIAALVEILNSKPAVPTAS